MVIPIVLFFLAIAIFVYNLLALIFRTKIEAQTRLASYTLSEEEFYENIEKQSGKKQFMNALGSIGKMATGKSFLDKRRIKLSHAQIFMRPEEFIGISVLSGLIFALLLFLLFQNIIFAIIGVFIGFILPDYLVNIRKKNRMKKLNAQLPEALTILGNGLRAGFSFTQAMAVASRDLEAPISEEFSRVIRDNSLGKTLEDALMGFSDRTDDEDIDMFITALIIQRQVGGNLAEILDTIAGTIRERVRLRGEVKTLTAQGRMSALVISILPPGIGLVIFTMNPGYMMPLFTSTLGLIMVGLGILMMVIGIYMMNKVSKIEI